MKRPDAWWQPLVLVGTIGALVWPVIADADDFPLSTYPMYSRARPAEVAFVTAQGVDASGAITPLGLDVIGASDDPLLVAGELRAAIRNGQADERCELILDRVLGGRTSADRHVTIQIVTERHDVIEHTGDRPSLVDRTVHAECGVPS